MRFKKLIAAGGAFLLVLGASTLGAAAAYADDGTTSGDTVVTDTTTASDPVVETPPAPEPVVETPPASDPVEETPPASDPDPVVETTDPVESDTPSSESDSDPPADTSSESSDSGSSSGSTSTKTILSFTRTTATLKTFSVADAPVDNTNEVTYWEALYPGTTCYKDDTTYGSVTGDGLGVVLLPGTYAVLIVKSGNEDNGDGPGNAVYEDPTPGTTYYGPLNGGGKQGAVSHWIVCLTDGEVGSEVTPDAVGSPQTCEEEELVGGTITVTPIADVTYSLVGPLGDLGGPYGAPDGNNQWTGLAPGDYEVTYTLGSGQTSDVDNPITVTVGAFDGDCVSDPCDTPSTAPTSLNTVEADECCDTTNVASLNVDTDTRCPLPNVWFCHSTKADEQANNPYIGMSDRPWQDAVGHAYPPGNQNHDLDIIPPFDYYEPGETTPSHYPGSALWLSLYSNVDPTSDEWKAFVAAGCIETEDVDPGATPSPQTCPNGLPVGGTITVTPITGVTYSLFGPLGNPGGPYGSPNWTGLNPGTYQVTYTLGSGQTSDVDNPIVVIVGAFDGDCGLTTDPTVVPAAVKANLSCLGIGSFTVSNDQVGVGSEDAVVWTMNGNPLVVDDNPDTFPVSSAGVINLHAVPGAGFGFPGLDPSRDFVLTFELPADCDLDTLALTGQSPITFIASAMALILGGLALFRMRTVTRRERPGSFI